MQQAERVLDEQRAESLVEYKNCGIPDQRFAE